MLLIDAPDFWTQLLESPCRGDGGDFTQIESLVNLLQVGWINQPSLDPEGSRTEVLSDQYTGLPTVYTSLCPGTISNHTSISNRSFRLISWHTICTEGLCKLNKLARYIVS